MITAIPVDAHATEPRPWAFRKTVRGAATYNAAVPPTLTGQRIDLPPRLLDSLRDTAMLIATTEASVRAPTAVLEPFLVRTEAVASSRIEEEQTTVDQLARAEAGAKVSAKTRTVHAAATALRHLVESSKSGIELSSVLKAHAELMSGDLNETHYAGKLRSVQNWIGGSGRHPLGAAHVPPHPSRLAGAMADLLSFANTSGVDPIFQAAVVHAQFEAIHPFTDGNGRIGRALINAVLRARGVTKTLLLPVAAAMAADRGRYFGALAQYTEGDAGPIVEVVAESLQIAATQTASSAQNLAELPSRWREAAGVRRGSSADRLIGNLLSIPVMDADDVRLLLGVSDATAYRAIRSLEDAGVLRRLGESRRHALWGAGAVLDEADHLLDRVALQYVDPELSLS